VNGDARIEPASFVTPAYVEAQFVVVVTAWKQMDWARDVLPSKDSSLK